MTEKDSTWRILFQIFFSFSKIAPVTFGGGYAMIPVMEKEVVDKRNWMNTKDIGDIFAVAESIPGSIAVNSSTFIGYRLAGVKGAIAALLGVSIPTFIIVVLLSMFFLKVQDNPKVEAAFEAIRATIVAFIVYAGIKIGKSAIVDKMSVVFVVSAVAVLLFLHVHPVITIAISAFVGMFLVKIREKLGWITSLEGKPKKNNSRADDYFIGDGI